MKWLYLIPAIFVFHTALTLGLFIVIEKWKHAGVNFKKASWWIKATVALGIISDATYNYSPLGGSLILWQFPRRGETLFTAHLKRLKKANRPGYRLYVCKTYCYILDFWDIGHCG